MNVRDLFEFERAFESDRKIDVPPKVQHRLRPGNAPRDRHDLIVDVERLVDERWKIAQRLTETVQQSGARRAAYLCKMHGEKYHIDALSRERLGSGHADLRTRLHKERCIRRA